MNYEESRKYSRAPYIKTVRYACSIVDQNETKKIDDIGISVDISNGGIGMLVDYYLQPGHVVYFNEGIKNNDTVAKTAVVRWTDEIYENKYRVGCKFV